MGRLWNFFSPNYAKKVDMVLIEMGIVFVAQWIICFVISAKVYVLLCFGCFFFGLVSLLSELYGVISITLV